MKTEALSQYILQFDIRFSIWHYANSKRLVIYLETFLFLIHFINRYFLHWWINVTYFPENKYLLDIFVECSSPSRMTCVWREIIAPPICNFWLDAGRNRRLYWTQSWPINQCKSYTLNVRKFDPLINFL